MQLMIDDYDHIIAAGEMLRTPPAWERAQGFYVYGWFDYGLAFYIGSGSGGRVAQIHTTGHGCPHLATMCENYRQAIGDHWTYRILVDKLDERVARATERAMIALLRPAMNNC